MFFAVLSIAAFLFEAWAFIDAIRRPASAFTAVGKQTKPIWLIILGVAMASAWATPSPTGRLGTSILPVAAFVAAAIYMADVHPKVRTSRPVAAAPVRTDPGDLRPIKNDFDGVGP